MRGGGEIAEIKDIEKVLDKWDWTRYGYEKGFPRGCQFSDLDAVLEFNGRILVIESKFWEGRGRLPSIPKGQKLLHSALLKDGRFHIGILFGIACENDPMALLNVRSDRLHDWRDLEIEQRRTELKRAIDYVMGVSQ